MATSISTIKSEAKASLKDKWVIAIVSAMTILFSYLILQNIAWVLSVALGNGFAGIVILVFDALFMGPLILGVLRHFWRMYGGLDESPVTAFYYFADKKRYRKALQLCVKVLLKIVIALIIFNLPVMVVSLISNLRFYEFLRMPIPMWSQNLRIVIELLSALANALTILVTIRYYLAPVLVIVNEELDVDEAIHMSVVISKTALTDLFFLALSLALWIVISLVFYIPLVFTLPYMLMCYIIHSVGAIRTYNDKIKKLNDEYFPSFIAGA